VKRTAIFTQNILNKHKRTPTHTNFIIMKALPTALVAAAIIALATAFVTQPPPKRLKQLPFTLGVGPSGEDPRNVPVQQRENQVRQAVREDIQAAEGAAALKKHRVLVDETLKLHNDYLTAKKQPEIFERQMAEDLKRHIEAHNEQLESERAKLLNNAKKLEIERDSKLYQSNQVLWHTARHFPGDGREQQLKIQAQPLSNLNVYQNELQEPLPPDDDDNDDWKKWHERVEGPADPWKGPQGNTAGLTLGNYNAETFGAVGVGGKQRKKTNQHQAAPAAGQSQTAPAPAQQFNFQALKNFEIKARPEQSRPKKPTGKIINHKFVQKSPAAKSSTSKLGKDVKNTLLNAYTPEAVLHRFKEQQWGNTQSSDPMDQLLENDNEKLLQFDKEGKLPKHVTDTDTDIDMDALLKATREIVLQEHSERPNQSQNP
jgi:hypothetical protein